MSTRTASSTGPGIGNIRIPASQRSGLGIRPSRANNPMALIVLVKKATIAFVRVPSIGPSALSVQVGLGASRPSGYLGLGAPTLG